MRSALADKGLMMTVMGVLSAPTERLAIPAQLLAILASMQAAGFQKQERAEPKVARTAVQVS